MIMTTFNETFVYTGRLTADDRTKEIIKEFEEYIRSKDPLAINSILTLMYS